MSSILEDLHPMAEEAAGLLKCLAHPARLTICCQLKDREMSVGNIEKTLNIRQPRLSRELGKLRDAGILATRRESKVVFYRLADKRVGPIIESLCTVMKSEGDKPNDAEAPKEQSAKFSGGYGVFPRLVSGKDV